MSKYNLIPLNSNYKTLSFNNSITNEQYNIQATTYSMHVDLTYHTNLAYAYTLDTLFASYEASLSYTRYAYGVIYHEVARYEYSNNAYVYQLSYTLKEHAKELERLGTDFEYISNVTGYKLVADDLAYVKKSVIDTASYLNYLSEYHTVATETFDALNEKDEELTYNINNTLTYIDDLTYNTSYISNKLNNYIIYNENQYDDLSSEVNTLNTKLVIFNKVKNIYNQGFHTRNSILSYILNNQKILNSSELDGEYADADMNNDNVINMDDYVEALSYINKLVAPQTINGNADLSIYLPLYDTKTLSEKTQYLTDYTYILNDNITLNSDNINNIMQYIDDIHSDIAYTNKDIYDLTYNVHTYVDSFTYRISNLEARPDNDTKYDGEIKELRQYYLGMQAYTTNAVASLEQTVDDKLTEQSGEISKMVNEVNKAVSKVNLFDTYQFNDMLEDIEFRYQTLDAKVTLMTDSSSISEVSKNHIRALDKINDNIDAANKKIEKNADNIQKNADNISILLNNKTEVADVLNAFDLKHQTMLNAINFMGDIIGVDTYTITKLNYIYNTDNLHTGDEIVARIQEYIDNNEYSLYYDFDNDREITSADIDAFNIILANIVTNSGVYGANNNSSIDLGDYLKSINYLSNAKILNKVNTLLSSNEELTNYVNSTVANTNSQINTLNNTDKNLTNNINNVKTFAYSYIYNLLNSNEELANDINNVKTFTYSYISSLLKSNEELANISYVNSLINTLLDSNEETSDLANNTYSYINSLSTRITKLEAYNSNLSYIVNYLQQEIDDINNTISNLPENTIVNKTDNSLINDIDNPQTLSKEFGNIICGKNKNNPNSFIIVIQAKTGYNITKTKYWQGTYEDLQNAKATAINTYAETTNLYYVFTITEDCQLYQSISYKTPNNIELYTELTYKLYVTDNSSDDSSEEIPDEPTATTYIYQYETTDDNPIVLGSDENWGANLISNEYK